jgi:GGDEF domain-containing protein
MKKLRLWMTLLIAWLIGLWVLDRVAGVLAPDPLSAGLAGAAVIGLILVPRLARMPLAWVALAALPLYLASRLFADTPFASEHLPFAAAECTALAVTLLLARRVAEPLAEFHDVVSGSLMRHLRDAALPFEDGQSDIYREIHRARQHGRPLALLSIAPSSGRASVPDRLVQQVVQETLRQYVTASVADLLSEECDDYDIITYRDDHFVTVLPETAREEALLMAKRIAAAASERLGFELRIGVATFPDQEVTFDKLLETAEADMDRSQPVAAPIRSSGARERRVAAAGGALQAR